MTTFTTHSAGQTIASADINLIQTAVTALEAKATPGTWSPTALGFTGYAFDPAFCTNGFSLISSQVQVTALSLAAGTVSNLYCFATATGSTTNLFMALYNAAGTLLSSSTNQAAQATTTGLKTFALSAAQSVTSGTYYAALWLSGATGFTVARAATNLAAPASASVAGTLVRFSTSGTAATSSAPSPLGTLTGSTNAIWVACS